MYNFKVNSETGLIRIVLSDVKLMFVNLRTESDSQTFRIRNVIDDMQTFIRH